MVFMLIYAAHISRVSICAPIYATAAKKTIAYVIDHAKQSDYYWRKLDKQTLLSCTKADIVNYDSNCPIRRLIVS